HEGRVTAGAFHAYARDTRAMGPLGAERRVGALSPRQAADVSLDQRLEGGLRRFPNEHEREVSGVEAIGVERAHDVGIELGGGGRRQRHVSWMVPQHLTLDLPEQR